MLSKEAQTSISFAILYGTQLDHRIEAKHRARKLLEALAVELKDLPHDKILRIDRLINDLREGYKFDFVGLVDHCRVCIEKTV